ncbi:PLAC8-domain-containing protein [Penicillium desertorum]|uniref:PLAC8-domain-containing protein n=1 Tax=Penicillium desertorum TaxID=1303715 RepID=A0A9W9X0R5_9EURO|nr:PLAC8-domain-containing protein [Penicillium desertorum]
MVVLLLLPERQHGIYGRQIRKADADAFVDNKPFRDKTIRLLNLPGVVTLKLPASQGNDLLRSFSYVNGSCAIWGFLSLGAMQWIMQTFTRGEIRQQYGIEGSCCGDCCVSTFCDCCALIQEEKEAELRTRPELVGYQKPADMAMP